MAKAKIVFHKCIQDAQELGTDDEFMVSRVFFSIQLPDRQIDDLHADIKQAVGGKFEGGVIEVGPPQNLKGVSVDYSSFRDLAEKYFRSLVGSTGSMIHIEGCTNVQMRDSTFNVPMSAEIDVELTSKGGW